MPIPYSPLDVGQEYIWDPISMTPKSARRLRGYPKRRHAQVRRYKRGGIKRDLIPQKRPRRHARPWRYRTGFSKEKWLENRAAQGIRGSLQERLFYQALVDYGLIPGLDFDFQSTQLGGRMELGGLVADFIFPAAALIVQVQSYWHTITLEHEVRDNDQASVLRGMGWDVLEIWPQTIEDPAALRWWMERHILRLFGTHWTPGGW